MLIRPTLEQMLFGAILFELHAMTRPGTPSPYAMCQKRRLNPSQTANPSIVRALNVMMSDVSFNNAANAYPPMPWGICPKDGKKEREREREVDGLSMKRKKGSIYK